MIFDEANAKTLGMARVWIFGLATLSRINFPLWEACHIPDYKAVGIMRILGAEAWMPLLTPAAANGIQVAVVGLLLAVTLGLGPYRILAPLGWFALVVSEGMLRGGGVIPHAHMCLILSTLVLAFFPAADAFTLVRKKNSSPRDPVLYQAPLVAASLVFGFTYAFAAARRFAWAGFDVYFDDSILCATVVRAGEMFPGGGWGVRACESVWMGWALRIGFPIVTLVELLSPLTLFSRWFRWLWMIVMVPFHVGTGLLMGIWFTYNLALIPLLIGGFNPFRTQTGICRKEKPQSA